MSTPTVYRYTDEAGALVYVGSTGSSVRNRDNYHRKYAPWWTPDLTLTTEAHPTLDDARAAEAEAIATEHPRWNIKDRSRNHPDGYVRSGYEVALMGYPSRRTPHWSLERYVATQESGHRYRRDLAAREQVAS